MHSTRAQWRLGVASRGGWLLVTRGPARAGAAPVGEHARAWRAADSSAAARRPPTPLAREPFLKRMFGALIRAAERRRSVKVT